MNEEQTLKAYTKFNEEVERIRQQYAASKDLRTLDSAIRSLAAKKQYHLFADLLIRLGETIIEDGDYAAGITWIRAAGESFPTIRNKTVYYLRMAEYHMENGEQDIGVDYLTRLCKIYGESCDALIELQGMAPVWEKYRPLVAHLLPEPVPAEDPSQPSSESAMSISDILALPDADLLTDLSTHLNEMCANGDCLNALNKWERAVWYADELCMEVNSGGFGGYLYYHGTHFEKAYKAIADMDAPNVTALLDAVRMKFPRNRIPKTEDAIQNAIDKLEDRDIDFEDQDDAYYTSIERELLARMTAWVRANAKHFR